MKTLERRVLRGPNIYSPRPIFFLMIDLEDYRDLPSTAVPGFMERLLQTLPTLQDHRCSRGYRGGFVERLKEGTYPAHVIEHMTIEMQCLAGCEVGFGQAREVRNRPGVYTIVVSYHLERLVQQAAEVAVTAFDRLYRGEEVDLAEAIDELKYLYRRYSLGPSTAAIINAAKLRNIPVYRITEDSSLFQLGTGRYQKRIRATVTSSTSHIALEIACDKELTKELLREAGLPVPRGQVVAGLEEAQRATRYLQKPLVIKPLDGNQGKGVSMGVQTPEEVETAYDIARRYSRHVLVEEQLRGKDYRVLVVGDKVVAVAHRMPAHLIGDGRLDIEGLIREANTDPRRGTGHLKPMTKLKIDDNAREVLRKQGLGPESVPTEGQIVFLRENSNLSTGGSAVDVTDMIHPDNTEIALRAARKIGLDVAGIDIVADDIAVPLLDQGGGIIEVNAAPGIRMHQHPAHGEAHDAGMAIVDNLFPPGTPVRVPIVAITGTNGKTTTTLLVSHILRRSGLNVGTATTEGIFINRRRIVKGDCTGYWSARTVLSDPQVEFAVLETARGGLFKRGLAFNECDFAAVLNVSDDHLGQHGAETVEDLARVKSLLVQRVKAGGFAVLNADNEHSARLARLENLKAKVIFFSLNEKNPLLVEHLHRGGQAIYLREKDRMILMALGEHRLPLIAVDKVPMTYGGKSRHQIANAMAAVALLINSGLSSDQITAGLQTFTPTIEHNPARMNLMRVRDFHVLVDYAHNYDSYQAVIEMAEQVEHRRLIGSVTMPGDRYDDRIRAVGHLIGDRFDAVVVREMVDKRGRAPGELAELLKQGILQGERVQPEHLAIIIDERPGIKAALDQAQPGDLVVIGCVDTVDAINLILSEMEGSRPQAAEVLR